MATRVEAILDELREEIPAVRRILERVPQGKLSWKPHAKSRSLGELAMHVAGLPGLTERIAQSDVFAPGSIEPRPVSSVEEIRGAFEKNVRTADAALGAMTEETAAGEWRMVTRAERSFASHAPRPCEPIC